jgi:hypothetical protein
LPTYNALCAQLLAEVTDGLPMPTLWDLERNEERIIMAVCDETGLTRQQWQAMSQPSREPWLERTIARLSARRSGAHPDAGPPLSPARHSPDFRTVHWFGTSYDFNEAQAAVVAVLWAAWEQGTPGVGHRTLLAAAKVEYDRLPDVFKVKGQYHPAWGTMIQSNVGSKGEARLHPPDAAHS